MKSGWLAATNFERMHEVISAINTLSIHGKLVLAGITDPAPSLEIEQARSRLTGFLESLEDSIQKAIPGAEGTYVGSDPWLRELALRFLVGDEDSPMSGEEPHLSSNLSPKDVSNLVRSERVEDLGRLIPYLQQLRSAIEEQSQGDIDDILGNTAK